MTKYQAIFAVVVTVVFVMFATVAANAPAAEIATQIHSVQ
jgi:hypothetical protein